jgi:ribonuclease I
MKNGRFLTAALVVLLVSTPAGAKHKKPHPKPGKFDYYVLSLSWSPD